MGDTKHYRKYVEKICPICNKTFMARKDKQTTYCSSKCFGTTKKKQPKICPICGKEFSQRGAKTYCGNKCASLARRKREIRNCEYCGKEVEKAVSQFEKHTFCSRKCYEKYVSENYRGEKAMRWKGGIYHQDGYTALRQDNGRYRAEHILVMEQHIGRKLKPGEVVHHIDRDKSNNKIENLKLMTRAEHIEEHRKELFEARKIKK